MCNCFNEINKYLAPSGGELLSSLFSEEPRAFVATYREPKKGRRPKVPLVQATFCPFCGKKYPREAKMRGSAT